MYLKDNYQKKIDKEIQYCKKKHKVN